MPARHELTVDGDRVVCVHHAAPTDDWLFLCHGFVSDKSGSYEARAERAVAEGYNAVRFDFRGCGESGGAFIDSTLSSKMADLRAVVEAFDPPSYALFGSSFGAKVALHAAVGDSRVRAVAGRAPVTYNRSFEAYRRIVEQEGRLEYAPGYEVDTRFFEDLATHPFEPVASDLRSPVALFHGSADESVPLGDSLDAAAALDTGVLLQTFPEEGHLFSEPAERRLRRQLFDWLAVL